MVHGSGKKRRSLNTVVAVGTALAVGFPSGALASSATRTPTAVFASSKLDLDHFELAEASQQSTPQIIYVVEKSTHSNAAKPAAIALGAVSLFWGTYLTAASLSYGSYGGGGVLLAFGLLHLGLGVWGIAAGASSN